MTYPFKSPFLNKESQKRKRHQIAPGKIADNNKLIRKR